MLKIKERSPSPFDRRSTLSTVSLETLKTRKTALRYSTCMFVKTETSWLLELKIRGVYMKALDFPLGLAKIRGVIVDN